MTTIWLGPFAALLGTLAVGCGEVAAQDGVASNESELERATVGEIVFEREAAAIHIETLQSRGPGGALRGWVEQGGSRVGWITCALRWSARERSDRVIGCGEERSPEDERFELVVSAAGGATIQQTGPWGSQLRMYQALGFDHRRMREPVRVVSRQGADAVAIHELVADAFARARGETRLGRAVVSSWVVERDSYVSPRLRFVDEHGQTTCDRFVRTRAGEPSIWSYPPVPGPHADPGALKTASVLAVDLEGFFAMQSAGDC